MKLTKAMRAMICGSEPSDRDPETGAGVELRRGADYAVAKALVARGFGDYEQGQWGLPGLYFNNSDGLQERSYLLVETAALANKEDR